jgi:hypothetical protein
MGCLGKCGCGCCITAGEVADIADSVTIEFPAEFSTEHALTGSGCCWSASRLTGYTGRSYLTTEVERITANETIQVSTIIIESQKVAIGSPPTVFVQPGTGNCILTYTTDFEDGDTVCSNDVNCGTVLKEAEYKERLFFAVGYNIQEVKVSVHKELMACTEGGEAICRFIVECAVRIRVSQGAYRYESHTIDLTYSDEFTCCRRKTCETEKLTHDPIYNSLPEGLGHWSFGNETDYWIVRYKTYANLADIPATITFANGDANVCQTTTCQEATATLCYYPQPNIIPFTPGTLADGSFQYDCEYCLNLGIRCFPSLDGVACSNPNTLPTDCAYNAADRFDSNSLSVSGGSTSIEVNYQELATVALQLINGSTCHELTPPPFFTCLDCNQDGACDSQATYPGVDVADSISNNAFRNICNWWECQDCYFTGYDPIVAPYQAKYSTVDTYSFSQSGIQFPSPSASQVCIPFPTVIVRFAR